MHIDHIYCDEPKTKTNKFDKFLQFIFLKKIEGVRKIFYAFHIQFGMFVNFYFVY